MGYGSSSPTLGTRLADKAHDVDKEQVDLCRVASLHEANDDDFSRRRPILLLLKHWDKQQSHAAISIIRLQGRNGYT